MTYLFQVRDGERYPIIACPLEEMASESGLAVVEVMSQ